MNKYPSFLWALLQCLGDSIRIGLGTSLLLSCLVLLLGRFAQADDPGTDAAQDGPGAAQTAVLRASGYDDWMDQYRRGQAAGIKPAHSDHVY